jgi:hypothetical protein
MGTSKSHGGPTDTRHLLPAWAQNPEGASTAPDPGAGPEATAPATALGEDVTPPADALSENEDSTPPPGVTVSPNERPWTAAKIRLGRAAQSGGSRNELRSAGAAYVHARGGARGASGAARAGRKATASLAGFLSGIATGGIGEALKGAGLAQFIGRDASEVFAAITNALAPAGASTEEVAARYATTAVIEELYELFAVETNGLERLDAMSAEDVRNAIESSIAKYIYFRWLGELGQRIENKSVSAAQAERLEREMKSYVRDVVRLDLKAVNVLTLDWNSAAATDLMADLYAQAYGVLGEPV